VLDKNPVFDAISNATDLLKKNPGSMIAFFFLNLGLSIAVGIVVTIVMLAILAPFVGIWFIHHWLAILTGLPVLLAVGVLLGGYFGSSLNLMATEFYFQLTNLPVGAPANAMTPPPDTPAPQFE
jgi:ABC-type polysaccharide/polyol phosphate export permease